MWSWCRYAAFLAVFSGVYVGADETLAGWVVLQLPRIPTLKPRFRSSVGSEKAQRKRTEACEEGGIQHARDYEVRVPTPRATPGCRLTVYRTDSRRALRPRAKQALESGGRGRGCRARHPAHGPNANLPRHLHLPAQRGAPRALCAGERAPRLPASLTPPHPAC